MAILIVEDNATNAMILKHLARKAADVEVLIEGDATAALKLCHNTFFELLIVDQVLPGMTGLQFVKAIRQLPRYDSVPTIMVTADQDPKLREEALRIGVTDFLTKPVETLRFRAIVSTFLERSAQPARAYG